MDPAILVFLLLLLGVAISVPLLLRSRPNRKTVHELEVRALNQILEDDMQSALDTLREIAKADTGNLNAYIQVGDLYREQGNLEAAVRVHEDVLKREGLTQSMLQRLRHRLALDYEASEKWAHAIRHAEELLKLDKKNEWALAAIHRYQVARKDWEAAIKAYQREVAITRQPEEQLPALYKTQQGLQKLSNGERSTAITYFKQAIKLGNTCPAPYYQLGKLFKEDGNFKHAIDYFTTFAELDPSSGSLVYSDIEKMYFELGEFDQVEQFYRKLHKSQPENVEVLLGLANYFERKGDVREATTILDEAGEGPNRNLSFTLGRLHLMEKLGKKKELQTAIERFMTRERSERILTCPACGQLSEEPTYLCPHCGYASIETRQSPVRS